MRLGRRDHGDHFPFTAFTIFFAASSRSSAAITFSFDFAMISLP